jgi:NNP family nitrate/nitrite transporter-like MFS transporter
MKFIHALDENYEPGFVSESSHWHTSRIRVADMSDEKNLTLKNAGHWPTLLGAFLYFDFSFMVWTVLGPLSAHIKDALSLNDSQTGLMVAVPSLAGAALRITLGLLVDRIGAKNTGLLAQCIVMAGLAWAWLVGLHGFQAVLLMGFILGFAGASFAVALPQAGRWYPPQMQGKVLGLAGAGNVGVVIDSLLAPRLANAYGWNSVFGLMLIPAVIVFIAYLVITKEPPAKVKPKRLRDYLELFTEKDTHWFCFFYTISFGGFAGLAASLVLYFKSTHGLTKVQAGDWAALVVFAGVMARPLGGTLADRFGGIRTLTVCYTIAAIALAAVGHVTGLITSLILFLIALAALGAGNGSVFQLLPQRFGKDLGLMTGLVGAGGGVGAFLLATALGWSKGATGSYAIGLTTFAGLCIVALVGLTLVKKRWRTTWGALATARI